MLPRCLVFTAVLLLVESVGRAHFPLPARVLNPLTEAEAWNVIELVTKNIAQLLQENRLAEVPDQASLCSPALRLLAASPVSPNPAKIPADTVRARIAVGSLAQACQVGDGPFARTSFENLAAVLKELEGFYDSKIVHAAIYFCPMHPDFCSTDAAALCDKCEMSLLLRRIPYSFIYVPPGESSIQIQATTDAPLATGREAHVRIHLRRRDDSPVLLSDLLIMHTQPIHLLIVNPALDDYHHEHPLPTDVPGEYTFSFTPATAAGYRIFADLTPAANGVQAYTSCDLPGAAEIPLPPHPSDILTSISGGFHFQLSFSDTAGSPPRAGVAYHLQVTITDATGNPVARLEPVMNAFAHLVGFYEDYRTVVHLHPVGPEIVNSDSRGGPTLDFKFYAPKAGFIRLYCQIVVEGKTLFAPFDLHVAP